MENIIEKSHELLNKYIQNINLRKHCYAVESCMRHYAGKFGENEDYWASVGLLHDLDWELFPDTHPNTAVPLLKEAGFDDSFVKIVLSHAYPERTNESRDSLIKKYLFACDEITGLVVAYGLMKPGGIKDVEPRGVIKKMKDKAFARTVNRDDIKIGASEIGMDLSEHIQNVIDALKNDTRL